MSVAMSLVDEASVHQAAKMHPNKGLLDLPNEILAEILGYLLKAPALMINPGVPQVQYTSFYDYDDPACLNRIGTLLLYEHSTFFYKMRSFHTSGGARTPPQQWTICKPPRKARHLIMRLEPYDWEFSLAGDSAVAGGANLWLRGFRDMQTLQIDFCFLKEVYESPLQYDSRNEEQRSYYLEWAVRKFSEPLADLPGKQPRLQLLVFSGLPCNQMSVMLIKGWARFVIPEGVVGVGCGFDGCNCPNIAYRQKRDLDGWILCKDSGYTMQITY
ncbi:MAG: hypothetical protein L6R38_002451 [Xanthoria sp. 2 TBL-2021]|nr:MAG: hypothetical protein L6R38_002451 [Xanthoria sp. 2 TBL-2021]